MRKPHFSNVIGALDEQMLAVTSRTLLFRHNREAHDEAGLEWLYD